MLVYAAIDFASALPLVIGVLGLGGLVFTALSWRRNDTTAVIDQQSKITTEMKTLNDELRTERDEARAEVRELRVQLSEYRMERRPDG